MGLPPALAPPSVFRTLNLPQRGRQVLGADLNRSESSWALASPSALPQNDSTHDAPGGHCTAGFQSGPCPLWVKSGAANRAERSGYVRFAFQS